MSAQHTWLQHALSKLATSILLLVAQWMSGCACVRSMSALRSCAYTSQQLCGQLCSATAVLHVQAYLASSTQKSIFEHTVHLHRRGSPCQVHRPSGSCPTSRQGIVSGTRYHLNRDWCECKAMWLFHDLSSRRAAVCTGCNLVPRWWCHSEGNPAQECSNASPHMHTSDAEFCSPSSTVNSIQFHFPGSGSANTYVKCSWVCMQHSTMSHYRVNPPFAINT